jgi:hypothetical protein
MVTHETVNRLGYRERVKKDFIPLVSDFVASKHFNGMAAHNSCGSLPAVHSDPDYLVCAAVFSNRQGIKTSGIAIDRELFSPSRTGGFGLA